jgi:hypothetical protein
MQSFERKKQAFYYQAGANPLGGFFEAPFQKSIPSPASISLSPAGGLLTSRTEAFNFEGKVSCSSASSRVEGSEVQEGGSISILVTSVVEGLKILDVLAADQIEVRLSIAYPKDRGERRITVAGSHFENLRLRGQKVHAALNSRLLEAGGGQLACAPITASVVEETGRKQAEDLTRDINDAEAQDPWAWALERYGWMARQNSASGLALCALVDRIEGELPGKSFGHIIEIPDFGRIFLGELLVSADYAQLTMVRAELGCSVSGSLTVSVGQNGGLHIPP